MATQGKISNRNIVFTKILYQFTFLHHILGFDITNTSMRIFRENIHFQKANEMRKQYRFKYNLLRERCDAIRQDNEQLVSRIWEVQQLYKEGLKHRKYLMDKLDSYGDNFRSIPICVPNETDKDAQIFKEKIANKNNFSYISESGLLSNENSQSSISNFSIPMNDNSLAWKRSLLESGDEWNSMLAQGHKKAKKGKKEKKEPKSSNPVGRPRKKDKKEKKMNVDFSNDTSHLSMQSDSEHAYQLPRPELMQPNSSLLSEDPGNSSGSERLAMPKRPHNAYFYFCQDHRSNVQKELQKQLGPNVVIDKKQVAGILTAQWNELPFERKQAYFKLQEDRKREYLIAMRKYKDSKVINQ